MSREVYMNMSNNNFFFRTYHRFEGSCLKNKVNG